MKTLGQIILHTLFFERLAQLLLQHLIILNQCPEIPCQQAYGKTKVNELDYDKPDQALATGPRHTAGAAAILDLISSLSQICNRATLHSQGVDQHSRRNGHKLPFLSAYE